MSAAGPVIVSSRRSSAAGDRAVAAEAAAAAAAAPLRERSVLLHVRALAAEGRAAEAMATAQAFRTRLAEETGLDPGPELALLEQRVASGAAGGAPVAAPARRTVGRPDGPLVGRDRDREEVLRLLTTNATVTLAGPGGVRKTRLAVDVAAEVSATEEGDVVVVDLAAVDRPDRVCPAVASTLGLRVAGPVGAAEVGAALADRRLLLVLDNCEHLVASCRDLVSTLRRLAPRLRVLATSRVTLDVPGEYVLRLQPLPVPREYVGGDALRRQPAVRASVEHARRRRPGFELADDDVADLLDVLRRIDGLPLGIELAARQVSVMPLPAVRERLDRALDLVLGSVAHCRGDFAEARDLWTRAADGRQRTSGAWVASAALAAAYGGDRAGARALLARAEAANDLSGCPSHRAFAAYVEAEVCAVDRVEDAVPHYVRAIDEARACGVVFVEGVASVGLASAQARTGDVRGAAAGFATLLASWRQTGHATQLWTTARNAAALLAATGRTRTAALLVICADGQPGAAAVSPAIARHSGRAFVDLEDLVAPDELPALRVAVERLGTSGVLDAARADLLALTGGAESAPSRTLGT